MATFETERTSESCAESTNRSVRSTIGLGQAIALYIGAVLGAGVLVLPGQAATLAGPASLLAWAFVGLLGLPLALTFAALATRFPDAGGVSTFVTRAFGEWAGGLAGWWYFAAGSLGHTIVPLTGGYYVAVALGVDQRFAFVIAGAILLLAVAVNLAGLRLSARLQLALAAGVGILLLAATIASVPSIDPSRFTPFAPHGWTGIGQAAVVLFFAFAGWEAISHLAPEFRDVRRDMGRATVATVVIVLILYVGVAFAVVATGTYGDPVTDRIAVGSVFGASLGFSATTAAGVVAAVISLGTTNAFMASLSRLGYALGREGWFPSGMSRLNSRGVPGVSVVVLAAIGGVGLLVAYLGNWGTEDIVTLPSTLVLVTYLMGTAAGVSLLTGRARVTAAIALGLTALAVPFATAFLATPVVVMVLAFLYRYVGPWLSRLRRGRRGVVERAATGPETPVRD